MRIYRHFLKLTIIACLCGVPLVTPLALVTDDPDALWKVVRGLCVTAQRVASIPTPCRFVDLHAGYAVLKDPNSATQYLAIPTERISGIESPELLSPSASNYWESAWQARRFVAESAGWGVAREDIGLAVNSRVGRTQDQLHIHIDCVRPDVKRTLRENEKMIGPSWSRLDAPLVGRRYLAMRVEAEDLAHVNPFKLLADNVPAAAANMADQTLIVLGASFGNGKDGFYLLNDHVDLAAHDKASGEVLLADGCAGLKPAH